MTTAAKAKANKLGEVERVYQILRDWIITARLAPGVFLSELDLAIKCHTSRTPVREACTRLMQDKWLSRIPHKGFMVTPISVRDIVDMYDYRKLLEAFAVQRVAANANTEQIEELRSILKPETDPSSELDDILRANTLFHRRLAEIAGNHRVLNQLNLTLAYVSRLDTLCTQTVPGWIGHTDVMDALERRNPLKALHCMEEHIDNSRDKMTALFSR